ncbi:MAG: hypothetical protein LBV28_00640 [Puniceicoccales bacterium]|jgi:phage/plasmid-associated DNA primase|nr:hypothetical protein [Puniceicoccales bacterium]
MSMTVDQIVEEAMLYSREEREEIIMRLVAAQDGLQLDGTDEQTEYDADQEIDAEEEEHIKRFIDEREASLRDGTSHLISLEEFRAHVAKVCKQLNLNV